MALLEGRQLSAGYGERKIIQALDISLPEGKVTSIIGANGCGKSTMLKALSRLIPSTGFVYLDGTDIHALPTVEVAKKLAILPQSPTSPGGLSVEELVAYGRYPHQKGFGALTKLDREKIAWALDLTNLTPLRTRDVDTLSGGQRQRVWIAMALAQDTELLLLDEPTTYLDLVHQLEILQLLAALNKKTGKTIALVIHELNMASRFSDHIIALKDGTIAHQGSPEQIMTTAVLRDVFSIDACIIPEPSTGKPLLLSYHAAATPHEAAEKSAP